MASNESAIDGMVRCVRNEVSTIMCGDFRISGSLHKLRLANGFWPYGEHPSDELQMHLINIIRPKVFFPLLPFTHIHEHTKKLCKTHVWGR